MSDPGEERTNSFNLEYLARLSLNGADVARIMGQALAALNKAETCSVQEALESIVANITEMLVECNEEQADYDIVRSAVGKMILAGYRGEHIDPMSS